MRAHEPDQQSQPLTGMDLGARDDRFLLHTQLAIAPNQEPIVAADRREHVHRSATQPRPYRPVVKPRCHLEAHLRAATLALNDPHQLTMRLERAVLAHSKEIPHPHSPVRAFKDALEHQRVLDIAHAPPARLALYAHRAEPAALTVKQPSEAAPAIETRQTAPVDRTLSRNQGSAVAVPDQPI